MKNEKTLINSVFIPYVKGISEKFKLIRNCYIIKAFSKTEHTVGSFLMRTRPEISQQTADCVNICCECGKTCVGEMGRLPCQSGNVETVFWTYLNWPKTLEEGHWIGWNDARILQIETNSRHIKYKELARMAC
jgi:hypothetical protein